MACRCCSYANRTGKNRTVEIRTGKNRTANVAGRTRAKKWRPAAADDRCDPMRLLSARRETAATAFRKSVPRPAYQPPRQSFPRWEQMDLSEKLPAFHGLGPEGPLVFHKGPMGSNPLHGQPDCDESGRPRFSLDDPYCRDVSYAYNPLHDPHLTGWLTSPGTCELLHRQGLVTDDLDVVCSLKEHNEYRRFLGRQHDDAIAAAARDKNARDLERNRISVAVANHKKNLEKKLKLLKNQQKMRMAMAAEKEQPVPKRKTVPKKPPKREIVTKKLPKGRTIDVNEIETYSEFGRGADGRIDRTKYLGSYMKGSYKDYYLLPGAKRFFKQPVKKVQIEDDSNSRLTSVERRPLKCDLAVQAAKHTSLIESLEEKFPLITRKERIKILLDSMKFKQWRCG